jgi:hypothetical protein
LRGRPTPKIHITSVPNNYNKNVSIYYYFPNKKKEGETEKRKHGSAGISKINSEGKHQTKLPTTYPASSINLLLIGSLNNKLHHGKFNLDCVLSYYKKKGSM